MLDENEIKIVTRQETFNDLAVRELAQARAKCICRVQNKRCSKSKCNTCPTSHRYYNCRSQMSEYDQQRLDNYTAEYYGMFSKSPSAFMPHKAYCKYYTRMVITVIICIAVFMLLFSVPGDKPSVLSRHNYVKCQDEIDYDTYLTIQETILMTQRSIRDVNQDGKINCVDHAIMFYLAWSTFINADCEIVHNVKPGIMNHLFVRVTDPVTDKYIEVEPWTAVTEDVTMDVCWQNGKYDYRYNLYGETNKWLNQCKQRAYAFERFR